MSSLPKILADNIALLRAEIEGAQCSNASAYVDTILAHVEVTPTIQRAADQVAAESDVVADELKNPAPAKDAVAKAREAAIDALDILENVLQRSQPSEAARRSGQGW